MERGLNEKKRITTGIFLELYTLGNMINREEPVYARELFYKLKEYSLSWAPSNGSFYPIIKGLETKHYIEFSFMKNSKKYYTITELGRDFYNEHATLFKETLCKTASFYLDIAKLMPGDPISDKAKRLRDEADRMNTPSMEFLDVDVDVDEIK